jgi:multimeric flavodoxin WrbA
MQLTVFNGSPRGRKGNTKIVLDHFLNGFESNPKNSYEVYYLNRLKDTKISMQAFAEAETILLAHPLYTDAMPAIVKHFIEQLEPLVGRDSNPTLGIIVQSGFVAAAHSRYVEHYWEKLSRRLGSPYLGALIKGGCEPLHRGEKQFQKVLDGFYELGKEFGETGQFNENMVKKLAEPEKISTLMRLIVQLIWKVSGNGYWDDWLKENEAYESSFAQPYVDRT